VGGFNDIHCAPDGSILVGGVRQDGDGERLGGDLIHITAEHVGVSAYGGLSLPNGIALSPDKSLLFHSDTYNDRVVVSSMASGRPVKTHAFSTAATPGHPDGMAIDTAGHLWIAFHFGGCVAEYTPEGLEVSRIEFPVENILSVCFGGPERSQLFVVTNSDPEGERNARIFRIPATRPGLRIDPCRI
jgi:sugar lactone lactonase YvrE